MEQIYKHCGSVKKRMSFEDIKKGNGCGCSRCFFIIHYYRGTENLQIDDCTPYYNDKK